MNFQIRLHKKEQLDNLFLSGNQLQRALSSLKLINTLFGNHRQLTKGVLQYCLANPEKKSFHIVDLGCGGGDIIHAISKKLSQKRIQASFLGIDGNPKSTAYARAQYSQHKHIKFKADDILANKFVIPECDLMISSHFIYHFKDDALTEFLKKVRTKRIKHIIFSDLYRSKTAYSLFRFSSIILPISKIAKKDGLLAIQRAFTVLELEHILNKSNVKKFTIKKKAWFRTLTKIDL